MRLSKAIRFGFALGAAMIAAGLLMSTPKVTSADASSDARKQPMHFTWNECASICRGWVAAQGIVTADTPETFEEFARDRDLSGATIMLDSAGGSVNDAIALGRRFRALGALTSVGMTLAAEKKGWASIQTNAACESMCVFLLLSGATRYVPPEARVRVHQIWMGDRADDPRAASYTAQDLMIVERDIGRLAKFTTDMGGTGDLLALALSIAPWDDLHQMTASEMRTARLVTTEIRPDKLPQARMPAMASAIKPVQQRFPSETVEHAGTGEPPRSTQTAEATGGQAPAAAPPR